MTKTTYILTNGTEVNTLKEAQMSGMGYRAKYTTIQKAEPKITEKRKALRPKAVLKK